MQKASSYRRPVLTDREWRAISRVIPAPKRGPKPRDDREIMAAVCYATATSCSYESLPCGYPPASAIRTRVKRWTQAGVLPAITVAATPAITRMCRGYWEHLRYLSFGAGWKFHREKDDPELRNLPRQTHCK
jgi:transposase